MKKCIVPLSAAAFVLAAQSAYAVVATAPLTIVEQFNNSTGQGSYTVTNTSTDQRLVAFGVSNTNTTASVGTYGDDFACANPATTATQICYDASNIGASEWSTASAYFDLDTGSDITFEGAFGAFSDNVEPGENTFNFYTAVDGDLGPGDSIADFFLFAGLVPQSVGIAIFSGPNGTTAFNNIRVSGPGTTVVPVPAGALLLGSALCAFGIGRRRA